MKNYRLKPEAMPFFNEKHATSIYSYDTWEKLGIDMNALEEVQDVYLAFGHQSLREQDKSTSLSGWSDKEGSHFHFTIHFPSVKFREHDQFSNGRVIRELMDKFNITLIIFILNL